jgi:hypothetical protein
VTFTSLDPADTERSVAGRELLARLDLVGDIAEQFHPYQPISALQLRQRQEQIARGGESTAAWDAYELSCRLEDAKELAVGEGLLGLAVTMELAIRLLDDAVSLYAFAGRDEAETDPHIIAATKRFSRPAVEILSRSSASWMLS